MSELPTTISNKNGLFIQDSPWAPNQPVPFILTEVVSDDYLHTMGVPLIRGRNFGETDRLDSPPVILINEAMAKRYWPHGKALGAHVHVGPPDPKQPWITVVGIVGNVRNDPTHLGPEPTMYFSFRQSPFPNVVALRTTSDPVALTAAARKAIASIDAAIPMYKVETMNDVIGQSFVSHRLPVMLMTSFGALALLLASIGVYAMFANMAAAREREFGVRVALGSSRSAIATLMLRQGGAWMALGLALGTIGVILAARLVRTQIFGVPEFDPIAIGAAVIVLLLCAALALMHPVRRATRVDPITVLR
jgi:hypothetical protein